MEAIVLLGLVGAGHLFNNKNKDKNPITTPIQVDPVSPSGDNVYNSDTYSLNDNIVQELAKKQFDESQDPQSNVVNFQKIEGNEKKSELDELFNDKKDLYEGFTYSSASGGYIQKDNFMKNDQGIQQSPFFKGNAPLIENFDDNTFLNLSQGYGNEFNQGKMETAPMFTPTEGLSNVYGNTFGNYIGDQSRYVNGNLQTNNLPFSQELIAPIDEKDNINREIDLAIASRRSTDNIRTLNNQKLGYGGRVLRGKEGEKRQSESLVFKHDPETFYENKEGRWFKNGGAVRGDMGRPEQILPETYRSHNNRQELGIAGTSTTQGLEKRPSFKKASKYQLNSDTGRNMGVENPSMNMDIQQQGYRSYPNEREITQERNHTTNIKTDYLEQTLGIQDEVPMTKKQTTIDSKNNGYVSSTQINQKQGLYDDMKKTKKQTTIHSKHNGNITGDYQKRTSDVEKPEITMKDTVLFSHFGGNGGYIQSEMNKDNYKNAETNPTKEKIAEGRYPTINNVKISNGKDTMTVDIKKLNYDYINHRENSSEKVYQITQNKLPCEYTSNKDQLNDTSIADRINPELLDPFKSNPYTQNLDSFAY